MSEGDAGGTGFGEAVGAGADGGDGEVFDLVLHRQSKDLGVARGEQVVFVGVAEFGRVISRSAGDAGVELAGPDRADRVEDVPDTLFFKVIRGRALGQPGVATAKRLVVCE